MDIVCAPSGIIGLERPKKGLLTLKEGGFDKLMLDMSMSCSPWELENYGRKTKENDDNVIIKTEKKIRNKISEHPAEMTDMFLLLLGLCRELQIMTPISYAPYLLRNTERENFSELLISIVKESIKVCALADCKYLIVRPLFSGVVRGSEWEVNRKYYLEIAEMAKENDVIILLENQCLDVNGHFVRGICSDAVEAVSWIDRLNVECGDERFGFCMDVGVCSLCGQNMREFAVSLGARIKAVVLRDCDGIHENSMIPFSCISGGTFQTDWLNLIRGLREICFDGLLIMDFSSMTAAFSQFLRPQLIQFARSVAEFFRWQISIRSTLKKYNTRVLFGAGNMCRNFMKCYGEEFPPFFTCDNNSARWGEQFEGLEIKSPEALKELEPDCAIFICNIYYKEIEQQLREMGITNPIEYFNDEYMPSYYFDRLEYWEGK